MSLSTGSGIGKALLTPSVRSVVDISPNDRLIGRASRPRTVADERICSTSKVMVQPKEHGDPDLLIVLVDLDVVKTIDDPVDELDPERPVVRRNVDPIPADGAGVSTRRVRNGRIAAECPTVPRADEPPQLDNLFRDAERLCRLFHHPVEGRLVGAIHQRDEALAAG